VLVCTLVYVNNSSNLNFYFGLKILVVVGSLLSYISCMAMWAVWLTNRRTPRLYMKPAVSPSYHSLSLLSGESFYFCNVMLPSLAASLPTTTVSLYTTDLPPLAPLLQRFFTSLLSVGYLCFVIAFHNFKSSTAGGCS